MDQLCSANIFPTISLLNSKLHVIDISAVEKSSIDIKATIEKLEQNNDNAQNGNDNEADLIIKAKTKFNDVNSKEVLLLLSFLYAKREFMLTVSVHSTDKKNE